MPTLIVFCHLRWGFVYQRPQQLMARLARSYRVIFIEEPAGGELGPAGPRLERSQPTAGVEVVCPHTGVDAPGFHDDQLPVLGPLLCEFFKQEAITDPVVWFYTPMALPLLSLTGAAAVVYDCMDELSAFKDAPRQLRQRESALMKRADIVLTGGPSLFESRRGSHDNLHCIPSAVDEAHYAPARLLHDSLEADTANRLHAAIGRPTLGFFGVIDERLDIALLADLADAHPEWQIVMAGPVVKIDPAHLPQRANIHWLGMQPYAVLPYLVAAWDVCLLPFALNEATRFISPTKTLEYMAGEKPVVSTAIHDVSVLYGEVVRVAHDTGGFIAACEAALAETPAQGAQRTLAMLATVRHMSWDQSAGRVLALLGDATRARVQPTWTPQTAAAPALPVVDRVPRFGT